MLTLAAKFICDSRGQQLAGKTLHDMANHIRENNDHQGAGKVIGPDMQKQAKREPEQGDEHDSGKKIAVDVVKIEFFNQGALSRPLRCAMSSL